MKTLDPFAYSRPARVVKTTVITSVDNPEAGFRISLRSLDAFDSHRMMSLRDDLIARFVETQEPWPMASEEPVILNEGLCQTIATLIAMQSPVDSEGQPVPAEERYTENWLVGLCHNCPSEWASLVEFANQIASSKKK